MKVSTDNLRFFFLGERKRKREKKKLHAQNNISPGFELWRVRQAPQLIWHEQRDVQKRRVPAVGPWRAAYTTCSIYLLNFIFLSCRQRNSSIMVQPFPLDLSTALLGNCHTCRPRGGHSRHSASTIKAQNQHGSRWCKQVFHEKRHETISSDIKGAGAFRNLHDRKKKWVELGAKSDISPHWHPSGSFANCSLIQLQENRCNDQLCNL